MEEEALLGPPAEQVLSRGGGGGGGLETSCLALGLGGAAVDYLLEEARLRPEWGEIASRCAETRERLRARLLTLAGEGGDPAALVAIRVDCTQFVLQATQIALAVAKGAGFVTTHPTASCQAASGALLSRLVLSAARRRGDHRAAAAGGLIRQPVEG